MLKAYMHRRERYLAMLNDDRLVRPFAWGGEFLGLSANGPYAEAPEEAIRKYAAEAFKNSDEFFHLPAIADFELNSDLLTWTSAVDTPTKENNTACARYFPAKDRRAAVVVLPHWNAKP